MGCLGFCSQGPFVKIFPEDTLYRGVSVKDVNEIFEKDILNGEVVERLLYKDPISGGLIQKQEDINFYKKQERVSLFGCGTINPEDINEALELKKVHGNIILHYTVYENDRIVIIDTETSKLTGHEEYVLKNLIALSKLKFFGIFFSKICLTFVGKSIIICQRLLLLLEVSALVEVL